MSYFWQKTQEIFSNFWIKGLTVIPVGFFVLEEREGLMIVCLIVILFIDLFFGVAKARLVDNNFDWSLLGKKFSKKFLLYFFTLLASFVLHKSYFFLEFWFYSIGTLLVLSEFGGLLTKARALGFPIQLEIITYWNNLIDNWVHTKFAIPYKKKSKKHYAVSRRDLTDMQEQIAINSAKIITSKEKRIDQGVDIKDLQEQINVLKKENLILQEAKSGE